MSNVTVATVPIRLFGAISYGVLSFCGLSLNILLITVFIKSKSYFQRNAFYTIAWQLIICDVFTHTMEWIVPIPITFTGSQIYGNSLILYIPCFIDTVVYNGTLFFSFLMSINRFTVFILPRVNQTMFQRPGLYVTIGSMWLFVIGMVILHNIFACYKSFSETGFYYHHVCPLGNGTPFPGSFTRRFFGICSSYLPVIMFVFYVLMIIYIKFNTTYEIEHGKIQRRMSTNVELDADRKKWKTEFSLLAQSFVICSFIEVQNIVFLLIPNIPVSGEGSFIVNIIGNWVSLLLSSIHPIVLFTFNSNIRYRLRNLFRTKKLTKVSDMQSSIIVSSARGSRTNHSHNL